MAGERQPQETIDARLPERPEPAGFAPSLRTLLVVGLLYTFLVGVALLSSGIETLGRDFHAVLFRGVENPVAALMVGILATVAVQSSSVSTATIVSLVAAGVLTVEAAVPMVMGANIGTTVTNTLASLGHIRQREEFRRALAGATMHDFFNVLAVVVLLPLQVATGFLSRAAEGLAAAIGGAMPGGEFRSPIKDLVSGGVEAVEGLLEVLFPGPVALGTAGMALGLALIFVTLASITRNMRLLVARRIERSLNAALARSGLVGMVIGAVVTVAVQSSSITTSILIPLIAAGILRLENAYPLTLGANLGTTITALLAAFGLEGNAALAIALSHTIFNLCGIVLFYPVPATRRLPVAAARWLADLAMRNRTMAVVYVLGSFIVVPLTAILMLR